MYRKIYFNICLSLCLILASVQTFSQQLSSAVKQFVSVNADTVALIHVTIIDGTGAPAKNDQAIVIIKGRIAKTGNSKNITIPRFSKNFGLHRKDRDTGHDHDA